MNDEYQLVHYLLDPIADHRIPIALVARTASEGDTVVIRHSPGRELGHVMPALRDGLDGARLGARPTSLGPQVVFGDRKPIPEGVEDLKRWAECAFFSGPT